MEVVQVAVSLCPSCNEDHLSVCRVCGSRSCYKVAPACPCGFPFKHEADTATVEYEVVA